MTCRAPSPSLPLEPDEPLLLQCAQDLAGAWPLLLQPPHLIRKRGLGLVQKLGCAREAAMQRDLVKCSELTVPHDEKL